MVMSPGKCCPECVPKPCAVSGRVYQVTVDEPCQKAVVHKFWHIFLSLLRDIWLSASTDSLVQRLLFFFLESQKSWKKLGLDKNLLASRKEVCRVKQIRHFLSTLSWRRRAESTGEGQSIYSFHCIIWNYFNALFNEYKYVGFSVNDYVLLIIVVKASPMSLACN